LPQEEQSGNAKGGNDEKVRDDGDLQTKSLWWSFKKRGREN
jgi:hypothetical protein